MAGAEQNIALDGFASQFAGILDGQVTRTLLVRAVENPEVAGTLSRTGDALADGDRKAAPPDAACGIAGWLVATTLGTLGALAAVGLPRQMFTGIRENISPTIAAVATLLILFTACLMMTLEWLRGRVK